MEDTLVVLFAGWFLYDIIWWTLCDYYKEWRMNNG